MKKFAVMLLAAAVLALVLGACLPVDGEPETGGAGMAPGSEVSRTAPEEPEEEPEEVEGWGEGLSSFAAYSWNGNLLEDIQKSQDFGDVWWINDEPVSALYGEEVFADGMCWDGVFRFDFGTSRDVSRLVEESGFTEEELNDCWAREWPWDSWVYMALSWQLAVTYKPLPEGKWVTPSWWLPPEGATGKGEDQGPYILGLPYDENGNPIPTPEPTPIPEDRQAVEDYQRPEWEPAEGHDGYEMAIVHAAPDGRPLQVRLRWKNEEGFGFWAQLPGYALDSFWEHEGEWFVKVNVSGTESGGDSSGETGTQSVTYKET